MSILTLIAGFIVGAFIVSLGLALIKETTHEGMGWLFVFIGFIAVLGGGVWSLSIREKEQRIAYANEHPAMTYEIDDSSVYVNLDNGEHVKYFYFPNTMTMSSITMPSKYDDGNLFGKSVYEFVEELDAKGYTKLKGLDLAEAKAEQAAYDAMHPVYTYEIEDSYVQVNAGDGRHVKYQYDNIIDRMKIGLNSDSVGLTVVEFCKELEDKGYKQLEKESNLS